MRLAGKPRTFKSAWVLSKGSQADEAPRPMVFVNFVSMDREAVRILEEAGQSLRSLRGFLRPWFGGIDADDLHLSGVGRTVKDNEQWLHEVYRPALSASSVIILDNAPRTDSIV